MSFKDIGLVFHTTDPRCTVADRRLEGYGESGVFGRSLWTHQHGQMTADEARRRVAVARVGRLASIDVDGRPHVVPVCFALHGNRVVSAVDGKPKRTLQLQRLDNVRRDPRVQLLVDHYDEDWSLLWWVRISGHASVIERGTRREHAVDLLAEKYGQYHEERPVGPVLVIEIARISSWQAATS
jgi:PPOX class probable F420-dependent enzyme